MRSKIAGVLLGLAMTLATTGCYTTISVNFGNGTPSSVNVQSLENGRHETIAPGSFKKIPNGTGDLMVKTEAGQKYVFSRVAPFDVDKKFLVVGHSIFGPNSVTLKVLVETNMELYVLMPDQAAAPTEIAQPGGYPKRAQKATTELEIPSSVSMPPKHFIKPAQQQTH